MAWHRTECQKELHMSDGPGGILLMDNAAAVSLTPWKGQAQCVYIDPPFFTGEEFHFRMRCGREGWEKGSPVLTLPAFGDFHGSSREEFLTLLRALLEQAKLLLSDTGALFLHLDSRMNAYARLLCDEIFGEKNFINEIIWAYQSGGRSKKHFSRKHDVILFYAKSRNLFFDITRVPIPRGENRENHMKRSVDENGRACRTIRVGGKVYTYYDDEPVYPDDVWMDVSHLQQKDPQRTGYDTQKPRALLDRIIRCCTRPGDLVADLCCGSGTTLIAAHENGCRYLGIDCGEAAISVSRKRLLGTGLALRAPLSDRPEKMEASVLPGIGYYSITLTDYLPGAEDRALIEKLLPGGLRHPLDAVDQWSAGYLRDGVFQVYTSAARLKQTP